MSRFAPSQADLFKHVQSGLVGPSAPESPLVVDPIDELQAMLDKVRGASDLPWVDAAAAMVEEHRALWLAKQAGDDGRRLAAAIFEETERLFSAKD
jgi:hypothetical protein